MIGLKFLVCNCFTQLLFLLQLPPHLILPAPSLNFCKLKMIYLLHLWSFYSDHLLYFSSRFVHQHGIDLNLAFFPLKAQLSSQLKCLISSNQQQFVILNELLLMQPRRDLTKLMIDHHQKEIIQLKSFSKKDLTFNTIFYFFNPVLIRFVHCHQI